MLKPEQVQDVIDRTWRLRREVDDLMRVLSEYVLESDGKGYPIPTPISKALLDKNKADAGDDDD